MVVVYTLFPLLNISECCQIGFFFTWFGFFGGNGHRPDKSHFVRHPRLVLEGALYSRFSPPKIARYVSPPPPTSHFPTI